jgi:hypothetical protein
MKSSSAAMVNGGIHRFVKAASLEFKNGIRINGVSSGLVEDAVENKRISQPQPHTHEKVINGYVKALKGPAR